VVSGQAVGSAGLGAGLEAWLDRQRSLVEEFPAQEGVEAWDRVVEQAALADLEAEEWAPAAALARAVVAEAAVAQAPLAVRVRAAPRLAMPAAEGRTAVVLP
jgi:hypothetical protein